ncbi:hypothetical protein KPL28_02705 [Clostridium algidicarnis]|uniref:hypothetical protein n=1 Tax=Clostridium algidicarnis TaxID=37659 RepID=UPI001C0AF7DF|nr:hypothetical protein [Clostridium algidicarnis]MBU3208544.1 hypothetical protein [Clostridium algidicarnis]
MIEYIDILLIIILPIIAVKKAIENTVKEAIQKELKDITLKTVIAIDDTTLIEKVITYIEDKQLKEELNDRQRPIQKD